jgi:FkbM family methyltransferase
MKNKIQKNLKKFLNFKNGFFLEVGSYDGLLFSNTLDLEINLNWRGILIEPDFNQYIKCVKNRPNTIVVNAALVSGGGAFSKKNNKVLFPERSSLMAKIKQENIFNLFRLFFRKLTYVNSISLGSLLSNLDITKIDFFSLDVEGNELEVLKGINFNDVDIKYICIEIWNKEKIKIFDFLEKNNYSFIKDLSEFNKQNYPNWSGDHHDYLFKKNI